MTQMTHRVCLAILGRTRGLRGEMFAEPGGDWSARDLAQFSGLFLHPSGQPAALENAWEHQGRLILKLAGVDSIEQAERLRGQELSLPGDARPPVPEGEFYVGDLQGCRVIHFRSGAEIGVVAECLQYGGPMLLKVKRDETEMLIPFAKEICREVDITEKRIVVDPPEGLLEL
ncbi:MAG: 16S rRNA processing protein RimM [Acidobacteria bacterium]|nr:16S rRNA processing protein RimM [Acidobacteriota bacterium]